MDAGQKYTEEVVKEIEKRLNAEYAAAEKEIQEKLDDYFRRYEIKDKKWQEWVEDGKKTEEQYKAWKTQQLAVGDKWQAQRDMIARDLHNTNEIAKSITRSYMPQVYAENFNYATYDIEHGAKINTSFTLYSRESVERLVRDDPKLLPDPSKRTLKRIADNKDVVWNKQQLQSVMMQGILQGDSIPNLATRLAKTVGERDRKAAVRNARTMATATQNAGRRDAYKRAQNKGVDVEQMWLATMDNRTRHSHRWLDREVRPLGEAFSNGCEYPADPKGDPAEVYNCRCSLRGVVKGLERRSGKFRDDSAVGGMSYDEWRDAKPKYNPILLPEEKGRAIKQSYINEYRGRGGKGNGTTPPTMPTAPQTPQYKGIPALKSEFTPASSIPEAERYAKRFVDGGMNLTGKDVSYKGLSVEVANAINKQLTTIYDNFNIEKLSSLEAFGKANKRVWERNQDAPFATTNFGNLAINNTLVKDKKTIDKYINDGEKSFDLVVNNIDKLSGKQRELAEQYKKAGRTLVGNSLDDMVTHEMGHHISYSSSDVNKKLSDIQKNTDWEKYASNLSGYANHSYGEYVAESFNAYCRGEHDRLQDEIIKIFEDLRK